MNNYSKILIVGDLRTAWNYGAVATTEALLDLINEKAPNAEVRLIDHRSFKGNTPEEGYGIFIPNESSWIKKKIVVATKMLGVYTILKRIQAKRADKIKEVDNIPNRLDEYKDFSEQIIEGEIWRYEKKLIEWADVVIVNSEGNIVNGTDRWGRYRYGGRYVLFFEYLVKFIWSKPCYVINHTVDPKNRDITRIIQEIYPKLDGVYVREKKSLKLLSEIGITNAKYVPDALWSHDFENDDLVRKPEILKGFDFSKPYICLGDSSGIFNKYSKVKWDVVKVYTELIKELKKEVCPNIIFINGYAGGNQDLNKLIKKNNLVSVNINTCNYHELYYVLKNAQIFISGRWHASIISLMAKTPILLWGADSHKTEALYGEVNYPYEFFDVSSLPINIDRIVKETKNILSRDNIEIWDKVGKLKEQAMNNVDMLGK